MAINAELQSRRNSTRQKVKQQKPTPVIEETSDSGRDRTQLVRATRDLGGNPSPAFVSNSSIPTLERNVVNTYEQNAPKPTLSRIAGAMMGAVLQKPNVQTMQAARTNNNNYAAAQRNNQLYNDLKTEDVDRILNNLGQTDIARKPNEQFVESIKSNGGSTNPFDYKNFWDFQANSPLGGAALFDVLSAESHKFERQNLTPEMVRAGLTEKDLEIWNNARNEEERQQVLSQWAAEHPIVSTARSFPENIGGSLENVANILGSYATGTPMESKPTRAEIYRNAVSEGIDSGVGRFAYNAGTSAGDMILASLLAGPAGAAAPAIGAGTMGIEKASSTANDAIDRGLNPNQIIAEMAGSGLTTALTELIPFNNMFKGASILKGMASEGSQEIAEDLADTLLDELVTGLGRNHDKSSLSTSYHQYLDAGYTPYDAVVATAKDYGKQLIMDGALGAVTGGAVQGGANLVSGRNVITGNLPTLNQQTETQSENSKAVLDDLAKATEDVVDNPSQEKWDGFVELAEKLAEENPDISEEIGEIYRTVEKFYDDNEAAIPDTVNENVDIVNENVGIPVYRGYNRSLNPLDSNLARTKTLTDFLPKLGETAPGAIPLSYYTEDQNVAKGYARQNLDFYNEVGPEAYRILTGDESIPVEGETKAYSINPNNVFDITGLGEKIDSEQLYRYLSETLGPEFEKAFPSLDYFDPNVNTENEGSMFAYQLLRNNGDANYGDTGTRFYNLLKNLGYDAVRYAEQGTNQYAIFPEVQAIENTQTVKPAVNAVQEEVNTEPIPTDTIEQSQPEVKEVRVPRREISAVRRTTEGLTNKLDLFSSETDVDVEPLKVQLDEAYNNVINTSGNAQAEAIQNFNNTVDAINEQMSGAAITQSAREYNEDGYNRMRSVTDGRRIAITDAQKESTGYRTLRELNSAVYSGNPNSTIKFYAEGALNTIPLDNVYNEMRYLSNGELPAVLVGDQLNALVNYITQYKSRKGDTVEVANWDRMKTDSRTKAEQTIDDLADDTLDKLEDGEITAEEMSVVFNQLSELQRDNPRLAGRISQLYEQLASAMMDHVANASIYDDDIAAATEENIDELAEEIIEEVPKRHNDTAGVKTGRFKKSEVFSNTGVKGGMVNDKIRELDKKYGHMMYENNTEAESMAAAADMLAKNGTDAEAQRLMDENRNGQHWDNVDTDEMMMIYHDAMAYAESLDTKGENSDEAWGYAYDLYEAIKEQGSLKGQALQAYAKWSRSNTPEGLLAEATSIIERAKKGEDWDKAVAKETKGAVTYDKNGKPIRAMDVNFMREFMQEAKKLESLEPNTREFKHVYDNLGKMINTQIPSGMVERVRTLLMDNMLGNARTLITRNAGGNIGFNLVEQLLRKPLSGLIDSAVSKARGTSRTVGDVNLFTKEGRELYKAYGSGAKEALRQEIYDFTHGIHSSRSGEVNLSNATGNNRTVFKNNKSNQSKGLNYFLNKADNLVRYGLSLGDRWAYEATYSQTLAELQQLYDQGKLTRKFTTKDGRTVTERMTEAQFKKWAEEQAKINALEACYQDDSEMAQGFLAARKLVNKLSRATIGVDVLSQFAIPFAKTPANIIQRAIEYSPLGLAKNAIQTIREVNSDTGLNQRRFSVDTSRNIIGSALFALGILAAKAGTLTGGYSEDKDMREAQKEAGMQEYALNTGDKNISIDWIPVLGNNAVAAAAFYNAMQNNPELSMSQRLGSGLSEGLKTQFESSALQGLNRFISGSNSYSGNNGDLVSNAQDTLMSGLTQFVPSLLRQGAAATDPYRRQLSGANPNDYYRNAILNSIPGLRETLEPRISRTGEIMEQNEGRSAFQKWMDNFINPATVTVVNDENVRDEAMRLYDSTGNNVAFQPNASIGDLKVDDHVPTAEEYTQYQQAAYGNMNQAASELIGSDYYQTLTDGEKESMLADIYSAIKSVEKLNTLDGDKSNLNGAAQVYDEGGVDGLINYMIARNTMAQLGIQNNPTNREQILEVLNQGGTEAVQEMVDRSQELANAGIDSYNLQKKYDHATSYIPSLTPTQFVETWNQIDGMIKPNDSISQDEMLAYLNQSPESYNINQVLEYWNAYGDDWTYQPYWDEKNGVWKKHKP